jgi:phasin family protein
MQTRRTKNSKKGTDDMDNVITEPKLLAAPEKVVSFSQANVEAVMTSTKIWTDGLLGLSRSMAETAKASFDEVLATWKALSGVTSPKEAIEIQANLARNSFEKSVQRTGELTEASLKLIEQTMAPLRARMTAAAETFTTAVK